MGFVYGMEFILGCSKGCSGGGRLRYISGRGSGTAAGGGSV